MTEQVVHNAWYLVFKRAHKKDQLFLKNPISTLPDAVFFPQFFMVEMPAHNKLSP